MAVPRPRPRPARLVLVACAALCLGGCILTLGAPLTRRIEPDAWTFDAGAGPLVTGSATSTTVGMAAYGYAGRAIGAKLELGLMADVYFAGGPSVAQVALPVRWDPFPYEWPLHLLVYAGPMVTLIPTDTGIGASPAALAGLGLSWQVSPAFEMLATASIPLPFWQVPTAAVGARMRLAPALELGMSALYSHPGTIVGVVSARIPVLPPLQ